MIMMCKYLNGGECECEFVNANVCSDPSNCEYMEDDSIDIEDILKGNDDLFETLYDRIIYEIKNLSESYEWFWDKEQECFIDGSGNDIADAVYYDWEDELIHPKILQTYMQEYLLSKEIERLLKTIPGVKEIKPYCYQYRDENHIYKLTRASGFRINFREIRKKIKEAYNRDFEIIEYNHDEEGEFIVIKLLL